MLYRTEVTNGGFWEFGYFYKARPARVCVYYSMLGLTGPNFLAADQDEEARTYARIYALPFHKKARLHRGEKILQSWVRWIDVPE